MWPLIILVALPIVEIALFIVVGGAIGVLPTISLVILAAVFGMMLIRRQGVRALGQLQTSLEAGGDPRGPLAHGAMTVLAGVLLIIPGFLTDAIGLALLVPAVRRFLIRLGVSQATVRATGFVRTRQPQPQAPDVIDVDFEVVEEEPRRRGRSGWTQPH